MTTWSIRFRGKDERETLARADWFFLENKEAIGLDREEFFSRLLMSDDGTEASFLSTAEPLWNVRPDAFADAPVGTEPAVHSTREGYEIRELPGSGPEPASEEDAL